MSRNSTAQGAVISLSYRPQTSRILMFGPAAAADNFASMRMRMGDFMLGNSRMRLYNINYAETC